MRRAIPAVFLLLLLYRLRLSCLQRRFTADFKESKVSSKGKVCEFHGIMELSRSHKPDNFMVWLLFPVALTIVPRHVRHC